MFLVSSGWRVRAGISLFFAAAVLLAWHPWTSTARASSVSGTKVSVRQLKYTSSEPKYASKVSVGSTAARDFANKQDGFALISVKGELTPARTTDAGRTWTVAGPGIFLEGAADAPLTVENIGVKNKSTFYAYGGGQVVDITSDGGKVWRQVLFQGLEAGVSPVDRGIAAYVDEAGATLQFYTRDGGRNWKLAKGQNF